MLLLLLSVVAAAAAVVVVGVIFAIVAVDEASFSTKSLLYGAGRTTRIVLSST